MMLDNLTYLNSIYVFFIKDHLPPSDSVDDSILSLSFHVAAEGLEYFRLGGIAISEDDRLMAYSTDTDGSERYTIRFRLASPRPRFITGVLCASDQREAAGCAFAACEARRASFVPCRKSMGLFTVFK